MSAMPLSTGGPLDDLVLADPPVRATLSHELVGASGAPVILALGGISANRHVVSHAGDPTPGWWEGLAGSGGPFDLRRRRVLGVEFRDGGRATNGRPDEIGRASCRARV